MSNNTNCKQTPSNRALPSRVCLSNVRIALSPRVAFLTHYLYNMPPFVQVFIRRFLVFIHFFPAMQGRIRSFAYSLTYFCICVILACNYFAFQVELFECEYEANQPIQSETGDALSAPTITWESFDKDHAQKPYIVKVHAEIECLVRLYPILLVRFFEEPTLQAIRDKSPPILPNTALT